MTMIGTLIYVCVIVALGAGVELGGATSWVWASGTAGSTGTTIGVVRVRAMELESVLIGGVGAMEFDSVEMPAASMEDLLETASEAGSEAGETIGLEEVGTMELGGTVSMEELVKIVGEIAIAWTEEEVEGEPDALGRYFLLYTLTEDAQATYLVDDVILFCPISSMTLQAIKIIDIVSRQYRGHISQLESKR
ncbi:unnamed protein product [Calypogeia fissa]